MRLLFVLILGLSSHSAFAQDGDFDVARWLDACFDEAPNRFVMRDDRRLSLDVTFCLTTARATCGFVEAPVACFQAYRRTLEQRIEAMLRELPDRVESDGNDWLLNRGLANLNDERWLLSHCLEKYDNDTFQFSTLTFPSELRTREIACEYLNADAEFQAVLGTYNRYRAWQSRQQ